MTYRDVYIGELSNGPDPLDWGSNPGVGNTPTNIGPFFPPSPQPGHLPAYPHTRLIDKISGGQLRGKQVDWGAWAARVTVPQILKFIEEAYGASALESESKLKELVIFVRSLPSDREYALIACEL